MDRGLIETLEVVEIATGVPVGGNVSGCQNNNGCGCGDESAYLEHVTSPGSLPAAGINMRNGDLVPIETPFGARGSAAAKTFTSSLPKRHTPQLSGWEPSIRS